MGIACPHGLYVGYLVVCHQREGSPGDTDLLYAVDDGNMTDSFRDLECSLDNQNNVGFLMDEGCDLINSYGK